ncbi:lipoprotein [Streptomyces prasinosporus]|uniref:Lipoprotein n=1 Tax=Streptomyces prasinosporus TaxID=68256 RepID=A0ABP6TSL7_9ACTN
MRTTALRRTVLIASAAALALVATACGGDQDGGDTKTKGGGSDKPAAKALTAGELEKLVLATGDLEDHKVRKPGKDDVFAPGSVSAGQAECEPVARVLSAQPAGEPAASAQRLVTQESATAGKDMPSMEELAEMTEEEAEEAMLASLDITKTMTSLWSYDADGAERTLETLREAGEKCAGGFTMTADGEEQRITGVTEEELAAGEDAVAWTVGTELDGTPAETKVVVFRQGTTLAGFSSFNIAAVGKGEAFGQPTAVIEAQEAKLG